MQAGLVRLLLHGQDQWVCRDDSWPDGLGGVDSGGPRMLLLLAALHRVLLLAGQEGKVWGAPVLELRQVQVVVELGSQGRRLQAGLVPRPARAEVMEEARVVLGVRHDCLQSGGGR